MRKECNKKINYGRRGYLLVCLLMVSCITKSQDASFKYRPLPDIYAKQTKQFAVSKIAQSTASVYDLTNALPKGYLKDGSVDYTSYIQTALDKYRNVVFPAFPLLINEKGLSVSSNSNLTFPSGAVLLLQPNNKETYEVLRVHNANNVNIYSPVIIGDKDKHLGNTGQWGMGIAIRASKDINIVNPTVSKCWGDGIYVGQIGDNTSENITISNAMLDANRRNGISITSVNGLKLISPVISNTFGQMPMCGIDIEPNNNRNTISNIEIKDPITFNNKKYGIIVSMKGLIGVNPKDIGISIENHIDDGSTTGFVIGEIKDSGNKPLGGTIDVVNPVWKNNPDKSFRYLKHNYGFTVRLKNISVEKTDTKGNEYSDKTELLRIKQMLGNQRKIELQ